VRAGQVTALLVLALVPLGALAIAATVVIGAPVVQVGLERRAEAVALAGARAVATGMDPPRAHAVASVVARRIGLSPDAMSIEIEGGRVVVTVRRRTPRIRLPGAARPLRLPVEVRATAQGIVTQDGAPGAVLEFP
jgi:hypothetical protein